ncbi:hypothetical protein X793_03560 [Dehalococcoides mccartyi CG4]|nr:hypothetical protein X793_03560 [Dehalococcoides mccartyi CG4]
MLYTSFQLIFSSYVPDAASRYAPSKYVLLLFITV